MSGFGEFPMLNADKPQNWKADTLASIDFYNDWFLRFAPATYRDQRKRRIQDVEFAFDVTKDLRELNQTTLVENPGILSILRMSVAPPIAQDRLVGLAHSSKSVLSSMEGDKGKAPRMPPGLSEKDRVIQATKILDVIREMLDVGLFPWLSANRAPQNEERTLAIAIVADRLCGSSSDPIIRNEQESRQLKALASFLDRLGYREIEANSFSDIMQMPTGCYAFRKNISVPHGKRRLNVPVDCILSRHARLPDEPPIFIEAKSAGDFTNTNKRRKEEAAKYSQLKRVFGKGTKYILFLCGYFDAGYPGYEAAEGIDWIWEHRIDDFLGMELSKTPEEPAVKEGARKLAYLEDATRLEDVRFSRQKEVDSSKSLAERNVLGQYSTPYVLARDIVSQALRFGNWTSSAPMSVIEPSCGSGVFLSALLDEPEAPRFLFTGVEIDPAYSRICVELFGNSGIKIVTGDFFDYALSPSARNSGDLLVANPPYVRHHHIDFDLKSQLQERVNQELGIQVSGLSGLYLYFILLAHRVLREGAVASWLIPCEFLYTNYGRALREYMLTRVTLLRLHLFATDDLQFSDALVSSCVITYRKAPPAADAEFVFTEGQFVADDSGRAISNATLDYGSKWSFAPIGDDADESGTTIGDLFKVTRGIATGNNDFFIMEAEKALWLGLDEDVLTPILPGPRNLRVEIINADADGRPLIDKPRYLLSLDLPLEEIKVHYPAAYRYLKHGEEQGVPDGGLCKMRKLWYAQEKRQPPPFLVSYMGRTDSGGKKALRFFLNKSDAIATNGFLCLYPRPFLAARLKERSERREEIFELLNEISGTRIVSAGRHYGGGLKKIEPKELACVRLPKLPAWLEPPPRQPMLIG
jgi:adenine-specific DNA-methyltransferase